jgi:hypothetical protein
MENSSDSLTDVDEGILRRGLTGDILPCPAAANQEESELAGEILALACSVEGISSALRTAGGRCATDAVLVLNFPHV